MENIQRGIYTYENLTGIDDSKLPTEIVVNERISNEAVLIRLLSGTLNVKYTVNGEEKEIEQNTNYSVPGLLQNTSFSPNIIKDFFGFDKFNKSERKIVDDYLRVNRRNHFIHENLLSELTSAIVWQESSPIESFVHIYRALEFISYSFPLIYASKSTDYRGTYEKLKKFMSGDSIGELKFFKTFIAELFKNNILINYEFEAYFLNGCEEKVKTELQRVINNPYYEFDGNTLKIRLMNIIDLIVTLRNRYFHMLVGQGMENFYDVSYDKRDLFSALTPIFINWLTLVYKEIIDYSVGLL